MALILVKSAHPEVWPSATEWLCPQRLHVLCFLFVSSKHKFFYGVSCWSTPEGCGFRLQKDTLKKKAAGWYIISPTPPAPPKKEMLRADWPPPDVNTAEMSALSRQPDLSLAHLRPWKLNSGRHWWPKSPSGNPAATVPWLCQIKFIKISPEWTCGEPSHQLRLTGAHLFTGNRPNIFQQLQPLCPEKKEDDVSHSMMRKTDSFNRKLNANQQFSKSLQADGKICWTTANFQASRKCISVSPIQSKVQSEV